MTCEEAEIAIGMRQHGALAAEEMAVLEAHLTGCADCRAFATISQETEHVMQAKMVEEVGRINWERIAQQWRNIQTRDAKQVKRGIFIAIVISLASGMMAERTWLDVGIQAVVLPMGLWAAFAWRTRGITKREAAAQHSQLELFVLFRQQTERMLRHQMVMRFVAPLFGAGWLLLGVVFFRENGRVRELAFWCSLSLFFFVMGALCARAYRRLKAETRELA